MNLAPLAVSKFFDNNGNPLNGGLLYTYTAGTSSKVATYTDSTGATPNTNPVVLDFRGEANVWLDPTLTYKFTLAPVGDTDPPTKPIWTVDSISAGLTATQLTANFIGAILYPPTVGELAVGAPIVNARFPWYYIDRYGNNTTPGSTDMHNAAQYAVDSCNADGGGVVHALDGHLYRLVCGGASILTIQAALIVKAGVLVALNRATLACECGTGGQSAIWLYGDGASIDNGIVTVASSGSPGSQFFFHSSIAVGVPNNAGDSASSPSAGQFMKDWSITRMKLSTTRQYCPVIQGIGGVSHGKIDLIEIPSSALHSGIYFDWGNTGTISSASIAAARVAFDAGTAYTTHPNNIQITNISVGNLSVAVSGDNGGRIVRLSGCYEIEVDGAQADSVTYGGYDHVGGDLGFEFARPDDKRQAYKNNTCRNMSIRAPASALYGAYVDTLGDNVYREQFLTGYVPISNPLWHANIVIEDNNFVGANTDTTYGIRVIQARGVHLNRNTIQRWTFGVFFDEFVQDCSAESNDIFANRRNGVQVGSQQLREGTTRVDITRNAIYGNATDTTAFGVRQVRGNSIRIRDNDFGVPGEATQVRAVLVDDVSGANRDISITDNRCWGATSTPYNLQSGTPADALMYRVITEFRNNTAPGVAAISGGQTYIPIILKGILSYLAVWWQNPNTSVPTDGTWYRGDWLEQALPSASTKNGDRCTAAGTFGTLASITNGATTNGSADITCSITGITCTTTAAGYSVVVSSATGMRAGMKCSITAAGIVNANILSVSGTTLQLDTMANAALVGTAFTTCGLIEGEVISLNTAPARTSCVVLKINGTTVSLDTSMGSTEVARTISYTTPIFKAEATLAP